MYAMQTIASKGDIEKEALIQYIINRVLDEENNKRIFWSRYPDTIEEKFRTLRSNKEEVGQEITKGVT